MKFAGGRSLALSLLWGGKGRLLSCSLGNQEIPVKSYRPQESASLWHLYFNMTIHFNTFLCLLSSPPPLWKEQWLLPLLLDDFKRLSSLLCNLMLTSRHPALSLESQASSTLSFRMSPVKPKERPGKARGQLSDGITYHMPTL